MVRKLIEIVHLNKALNVQSIFKYICHCKGVKKLVKTNYKDKVNQKHDICYVLPYLKQAWSNVFNANLKTMFVYILGSKLCVTKYMYIFNILLTNISIIQYEDIHFF